MKTTLSAERATLVRYLLGELPEGERERIEERYMLDEHCGELLDELEMDLVDAYVEGTLTQQQRRHFESRFMVTQERKAAVQAAYLSKVYRDRIAEPLIAPDRSAPKWLPRLPTGMNRLLPALAAGLAVAVAGGGAWFLYDRWEAKPEIRSVARNPFPKSALPVQNNAASRAPDHAKPETPAGITSTATHGGTAARASHGTSRTTERRVPTAAPETQTHSSETAKEASNGASTVPSNGVVTSNAGDGATPSSAAASGAITITARSAAPAAQAPGSVSPTAGDRPVTGPTVASSSQDRNSLAAIQKKLASEYVPTQPSAANDDIVTAGAVLVLQKSNIMMAPVSGTNLYQNTYQNGKITQNAIGKGLKALGRWNHLPGATQQNTPDTRTFVAGEKIWVTSIDVRPDGVVFGLFTDAINNGTADVRYKASLKFPFPKDSVPSVDQADKLIAEVFKVQPADDAKAGPRQAAPAPNQAAAAPPPATGAAPPPIAPAPPPRADSKTIALKQTKEEVVANFGQPDKIINLGAKEIYIYKNMKVTFKDGKVTDVQ